MKKSVFYLFIFLLSGIIWGQNSVKGWLKNSEDKPVMGVNVLLMSLPDSVLIKGGITNEKGAFELPIVVQNQKMVLKLLHLEYQTQIIPIEKQNLGVIQLERKTNQLKEVVVSANRTIIEQKGSVLVTNIAQTSLQNISQMSNLIRFLPGVTQSFSDSGWEVFGKGNVVFYLNKKRVRFPQVELEAITPQDIETISIETQPGAEFDNSVGAVIYIKLKKKEGDGWNAMVVPQNSIFQKGKRFNPFVKVGYQSGETEVYVSGYYDHNFAKYGQQRKEVYANTLQGSWKTISETETINNTTSFFANMGVNHQVGNKHFFGGSVNLSSFPFGGNFSGKEKFSSYKNSEKIDELESQYDQFRRDKNLSVGLYYEGEVASNMKIQSDVWLEKLSTQNQNKAEFGHKPSSALLEAFSLASIKSFRTKNTLTQKLQKVTLSYGFEAKRAVRDESYREQNAEQSSEVFNQNTEMASFVSASFDWKKMKFKTGLRYEYVNLSTEGQEKRNAIFSDFLPSVSVSFPLKKTFWSVSYDRRITRPELYQYSDIVQYKSPYLYWKGDANLVPSFTQEFRLMSSYKNYSLALQYDVVKDFIGEEYEIYEKNPNALLNSVSNEETYRNFKATLSGVLRYGIVTASNSLIFSKQFSNGVYLRDLPRFFFNSQIQLQFTPKFSSLVFLNYASAGNVRDHFFKESKGMTIGFSYKIPKYNLETFLVVSDVLATRNNDHNFEDKDIRITEMKNEKYERSIYIGVLYKFNSVQKRQRGQFKQQQPNFGF